MKYKIGEVVYFNQNMYTSIENPEDTFISCGQSAIIIEIDKPHNLLKVEIDSDLPHIWINFNFVVNKKIWNSSFYKAFTEN